ncbi:hypothetical protein T492DRAFT_904481 [Pavlovales sp. CCMP2436]|nr:hypothetical protein T492DRAFT_904481 [Pavlovales sp. CCMP2436]
MQTPARAARRVLARLDGPRLCLRAASVTLLASPAAFYEALLEGARGSRRRVNLAALYLGTGELERALANELVATARGGVGRAPARVSVLLDRNRACRTEASGLCSVDLLVPLVRLGAEAGGGAEVRLFRAPALRGAALLLPPRLIEAVGVQHVKAFVFDDEVLLSGANLSSDYFTNRQDRYMRIRGEQAVADFFDSLLHAVGECSYRLRLAPQTRADATEQEKVAGARERAGAGVARGEAWAMRCGLELVPPEAAPATGSAGEALVRRLARVLAAAPREPLLDSESSAGAADAAADTWLVPTVQLGGAGLRSDQLACEALYALAAEEGGTLSLSSPYLNLSARALGALAGGGMPAAAGSGGSSAPEPAVCRSGVGALAGVGRVELLTAHSSANGFFGSRGLARHLPLAYAVLEREALAQLCKRAPRLREVALRLWLRPGWTFHAKGLWYAPAPPPGERPPPAADAGTEAGEPLLTVIGSSNYGARSSELDLEAQAFLVTTDAGLRARLAAELRALRADSSGCSAEQAARRAAPAGAAFRWAVRWLAAPFL